MPTASPSITTTFTVSVTDGNGCVSSDNVLVTVNALPIANAGSSASICLGNSTMLSATGGTSYSWLPITDLDNSLIDMPTASPLVATTYSVTVTDGNGCSASASVLVTVNDLPVSSLTSTNISCNGLTNGTGSVSVSGTSTYSYLWSTSNTTSSVSGLTAGPYSVIVTDNITSCTSTSSFTISEPSAVTLSATSDTTGICNGSVTVIPSGGTPAYTYLWNDPSAQTIATPINLCPGSYTVQVTDANGCIATTTTTIYFITSVLDANNNAFSAFPNPFMDKITIENQKGTESFELINAIGQIVWSGKNIEQHNFSDLTKGVYMMRVLDGNSTQIFKLIKE
jgi:hypothetical protein